MTKRFLLIACLFAVGCDPAPLSLYATPTPLPPPPPPEPAAPQVIAGDTPAESMLALTDLLPLSLTNQPGRFAYRVQFTLTEVTGASPAWIRLIEVVPDTGASEQECVPWTPVRIEPGTSWHTSKVSYCMPIGYSATPASEVTVTITYTDEAGHQSRIQGILKY